MATTAWTRRQFLVRTGTVVGATTVLGALGYGVSQALRSPSPSPAASASPNTLALAGSGSVVTPSPQPSPTPVGQGRQHFRSRPDLLPPEIHVNQAPNGTAPGYLFFTPANGDGTDGPTIIDEQGNLVWLRADQNRHATTFSPIVYQGQPALVWWEGDVNAGVGNGEFVLADDHYREITRIHGANGRLADLHEFQLTDRGTALFFTYAIVTVPAPAAGSRSTSPAPSTGASPASPPPAGSLTASVLQVADCAVEEVDIRTGAIVFEWHTVDHIGLDECYLPLPGPGGGVYDYVHANSIEVDRDGDLLVSARNTSAVYKVDRTSGQIIWRLGGKRSDFALADGAAFSWQHDVRRHADGTISLYDDSAAPGVSRGLILRVDEQAMTAAVVAAYPHPRQLQSTSQGNVQVLEGGHIFVGWGSEPYMSEFAPDGTMLYDASFPAATQSYRDFRYAWAGKSDELPAFAFDTAGDQVVAYASWNGATDVSAWELLGGPRSDSLSRLAVATRSGFETTITADATPAFIAVRPLDNAGKALAMSAVRPTKA